MAPVQDKREIYSEMKTAETYAYEEHTGRKEGGNYVINCIGSFDKKRKVPFGSTTSGKR